MYQQQPVKSNKDMINYNGNYKTFKIQMRNIYKENYKLLLKNNEEGMSKLRDMSL